MSGHIDRRRAGFLMEREGLKALVLAQPESIQWASGAFPGVASFWRRAGAAFLVIPADEALPVTAIVGDLQARSFAAQSGIADVRTHRLWVDTARYPFDENAPKRSPRPAQYELPAALSLLKDVLAERRCLGANIGLELGFVSAADFAAFSALPVTWADATRMVERLRAVKTPAEISRLRRASDYSVAGLSALLPAIAPGMDAAAMTAIWRQAALAEAARRGDPVPQSAWAYIAVAGDGFAPGGPAKPGDIVKIDIGCVIDGYSSDFGRTAVLGKPGDAARRVFDALHEAFETGFASIAPGARLSEVNRATATSMWDQGFDTYARGHFGHGLGASVWSEEWPFVSADSDAVLESGMVIAFETPWYIDGLGGFIIEDQLLITEQGVEVMSPYPRSLIEL
jgi:Xaa-Pro dipeptidase